MLSKTRPSPVYLGMANNNKYANFSGTLDKAGLAAYQSSTLLLKHFEYQDKANSTRSVPSYVGTEKIEWMNGRERFNPCEHYRARYINLPYSHVLATPPKYGSGGVYKYYYRNSTSGSVVTLSGDGANASRAASSRAWWTMQPRFEGQISMLNFLYELKDVKELATQAYHLLKKLMNFRRTFNHMSRSNKFDLSKPLSKIYLTNEFGIKPLLSDLSKIWKQLADTVQKAQNDFEQAGHDVQTRHYTETLSDSNTFTYGSNYYSDWIGTGIRQKSVFTASLRMRYEYQQRDSLDAFLKYWGLDGSYESFWEAIPFSFIVDYYIKIGKAIHAMETDPNVHVIPYDYCETIVTTKTSGIHMVNRGTLKFGVIDGVLTNEGLLSGYEARRYSRRIVPPCKGLYIPKVSRPSEKQLLNIAAVVRNFF